MTDQHNRNPEIRVVVIDIDGTLLDSKHELTPRVETALKAAIAQGVKVVLATGKTYRSCEWITERLDHKAPGIYLQGLVIHDETGALRHQWTLDRALARSVITFAEDRGFMMVGFSQDRILARAADQRLTEGFSNYHEIALEVVGPLQNILTVVPLNKLIAIGEPRAIKALRWQLNLQVGGAGRLMQAGVPWMLELLPPGCSKGAALAQLLKDMQVDPVNVMAIGDAENDIEMIKLAGVGVTMGQAAQEVKDIANYVVASNDQDGVAEAVERFVLARSHSDATSPNDVAQAGEIVSSSVAVATARATPDQIEQTEPTEAGS